MAGVQVNLRLDEGVVERVDVVRGLVPRNTWLVNAVQVALEEWERGEGRIAQASGGGRAS